MIVKVFKYVATGMHMISYYELIIMLIHASYT